MNPVILADNRFTEGTLTVSSELSSEYSVTHLSDRRPYTYWKASVAGSIVVSLASAQGSVNAFACIGHNLGTAAASFFFDTSPDGSTWTERVSAHPTTDRAFMYTFSEVAMSCARLRIVTASVVPELSCVAAGVRIDMPQPAEAPTVPYTKNVVSETQIGKTGHPLGTVIRYKPIEISHRFTYLDRSWVTSTFEDFWNAYLSENLPFFYAWDLTLYPAMVFYTWRKQEVGFAWPTSMLAYVDSIELNLQGVSEI